MVSLSEDEKRLCQIALATAILRSAVEDNQMSHSDADSFGISRHAVAEAISRWRESSNLPDHLFHADSLSILRRNDSRARGEDAFAGELEQLGKLPVIGSVQLKRYFHQVLYCLIACHVGYAACKTSR